MPPVHPRILTSGLVQVGQFRRANSDRPGDSELPLEERSYMVHISEETRVCRPSELEAVAEPSNTLTKFSPGLNHPHPFSPIQNT